MHSQGVTANVHMGTSPLRHTPWGTAWARQGWGRPGCLHLKPKLWGSQLNLQHSQDYIQWVLGGEIMWKFPSKPEWRLVTLKHTYFSELSSPTHHQRRDPKDCCQNHCELTGSLGLSSTSSNLEATRSRGPLNVSSNSVFLQNCFLAKHLSQM